MNTVRSIAAAAAVLLAAPAPSLAQGADAWTFQAIVYGYLPDIGMKTTFHGSGGSSDAGIDAATILDTLKFTFMGTFEARNGPWGVFTDAVYMNLGDSKVQTRDLTIGGVLPAGVTADVRMDIKGWMWTLAGAWRAAKTPTYSLDVIGGARVLDMEQSLGWQVGGNVGAVPLPDRTGQRSVGLHNVDAIVGVKGRAAFGDGGKWFAPYYLDIGAGESKFTWQAIAGVGYSFGWGDVLGVWRYVDYSMKSGKSVESVTFNGPAVGAVFRW